MSTADLVLTVLLVLVLPGYMFARSLARRGAVSGGDRVRRYRRTLVLVGAPLLAVATLWLVEGRSAALLGLGAPDRVGSILIGVAVLATAALAFVAPRAQRSGKPTRHAEATAMMPVGSRETAWFLVFALAVGLGWEVLYRGYLWWVLAPAIGTIGALATMALSYGLAHGYRGKGALIGSLVSAALFAGGYALTGSLWWLIVIHVGLPLTMLRIRPGAAA